MKVKLSTLLCCGFLLLMFSAWNTLSAAEPVWTEVGTSKIDITPKEPVRLSGYGERKVESEGIEQRLWARGIAIGAKDEACVLVSVENCGITADIVEQVAARLAKDTGLARERLVVCSTHTHTAPAVTRFAPVILSNLTDEQKQRIDAYTKWVTECIGDAAIAALKDRRAARITWTEGNLSFAGNRRVLKNGTWSGFGINAEGPVQHRLPALRAVDKDDKLIALVVNYACHCTTLGGGFNKICGDWAGYAAEYLEADHAGATTLITIGCGADANPNPRGKLEMAQAHGRAFANEVERLLKSPWRELPVKMEARLVQAKLPLAEAPPKQTYQATADDPKQTDATRRHARAWIARLERNEKPPEHVLLPVATWSFGEALSMLFLGGEVVIDYDTLIRERFDPARLWISTYANDVPCYIPSQRILKEGGYEAKSSMIYYDKPGPFAPEVQTAVLDAVAQVMPKAFAKVAAANDLPANDVKTVKSAGPNTPPPLAPDDALKSFRIKPGFRVELAACEPLVESPVCFDWGPDGRLWVVEMRDYPTGLDGKGKPGGRIKVLSDLDHDGRYDEAKIFLDDLACPSAVKVWRDGAIVIATTEIIFARDTDGDGKADQREVLFDGLKKGNQQHLANSLSFRLDGALQVANGDSGGKLRSLKTGQVLDMRGRDLSIMPDTGVIEARSGQTQFGTSRDDWDNWFGGNNSYPMWHYVLDDRYISRNPHLPAPDPRVHVSVDPGASRVYPISQVTARFNDHDKANRFTSACSPIVYRDTLLEGIAGDSFICEPVHNLVHREIMSAKGETFTSQRANEDKQSEFFSSTDNWCRPVNIRTGPDGALWIADMYRYVIEHPQWIPHEWQRQLNLRAGETCGRIYRIVPEKSAPKTLQRFDKLEIPALVQALNSSNGTVRDLIHQMLIWKRDPASVAPLREIAKSAELAQVRLQALCVLDCLQAVQVDDLLAALSDKHPAVRRHAIRISETLLKNNNEKLINAVLALEPDEDYQVQMQLAYSLGMTARGEAGRALGRMAVRHSERPYLSAAIASSALPHLASMMEEVFSKPETLAQRSVLINRLFGMAVATDEYKVIARVLAAATSATDKAPWRFTLLATFYDALRQRGTNVTAYLQKSPALLERKADLDSAFVSARALLLDATMPLESRVVAARLVGREPAMLKADLDALTTTMSSVNEPEILLEAVAALNRLHDPRAQELLFSNWSNRTPALRRAIIDSLLTRADTINFLLERIAKMPALAAAIDTSRRQRLLSHSDESIRARAGKLFAANLESDRAKVVAQHENVLRLSGDVKRGKDVFSAVCAACHRLEDVGRNVGPDLTALNDKSPPAMLAAILDPNRAVEDRYVQYIVATADGTFVGKIDSETASGITLLGVEGEPRQILRRDIRSIKSTNISLMPEGLEQTLDDQKLADVIAYLSHVCSPPKTVAGNQPQLIAPGQDGALLLLAENAEIYGRRLIFESQFRNLGFWEGLDDQARWNIRIDKPGRYAIEMEYACADTSAGNRFVVAADRVDIKANTLATGGWEKYEKRSVGFLDLRKGFHRLIVRSDGKLNGSLMDLRGLRLTLSSEPAEFKTVTPENDGSVSLRAATSRVVGPKIKYMPEWQAHGYFSGEDRVEWECQIKHAGKYDVILDYSVSDQDAGKGFIFEIGGAKISDQVKPSGGWEIFEKVKIGQVEVNPGQFKAVFAPAEAFSKGALLDLREVRLVPVR